MNNKKCFNGSCSHKVCYWRIIRTISTYDNVNDIVFIATHFGFNPKVQARLLRAMKLKIHALKMNNKKFN